MKKIVIVTLLLSAAVTLSFGDAPPLPPSGTNTNTNVVASTPMQYAHYTAHLHYTTQYGSGTITETSYNNPIFDYPTYGFWTIQTVTINGVETDCYIAVASPVIGYYDYVWQYSILIKRVPIDPDWTSVRMTFDLIEYTIDPK